MKHTKVIADLYGSARDAIDDHDASCLDACRQCGCCEHCNHACPCELCGCAGLKHHEPALVVWEEESEHELERETVRGRRTRSGPVTKEAG